MGSSADAIGGRKRHVREAAVDAGDEAKESLETWRKGERKAAAGGAEGGERSEVAMGERFSLSRVKRILCISGWGFG